MPDETQPGSERDIFEELLELAPEARAARLRERCRGDDALRARVERLLHAHERAADVTGERVALQTPATIAAAASAGADHATIGPYRLVQKLGEGGMGIVWLAEQERPIRRQVALKVIKLGTDTAQVIARFEAERQTLAVMDHPGIARVLDAGATPQGRPYFVMELVRGVPITDHCDRERLDTRARIELFEQVCAAVQHAHQKGIIHRDLKPSNVLVTGDPPRPKVIDFGIAKATEGRGDEALLTLEAQVLGTPEYMSPEQAGGRAVDTRSDVYSLGVLLYELLTGTRPFDLEPLWSEGIVAVLRHLEHADPERPSTRAGTRSDVSTAAARARRTDPHQLARQMRGELDWIVLRAMEKDPARRYESASALGADLRRFLEHRPVEAGPPGFVYLATKFARRHRVGLAAASVVGLALVGGVAALAWSLRRVSEERNDAMEAREAERDAKLEVGRALDAEREANDANERLLVEAEEARRSAEDQRDEAQEVTDFLVDMFRAARPDEQGYDARVSTLLRQAESKLERELVERPVVRARLAYTLGAAYLAMGDYQGSMRLLARAADLRGGTRGEDDPGTIYVKTDLAIAMWRDGQYRDAEAMLLDLVERSQRVNGIRSAETLRVRGNLAMVVGSLGRREEAERLYLDLLEDCRAVLGEDHPNTLNVLNNLVNIYLDERDMPRAESLLAGVLEGRDWSGREDEPLYLGLLGFQARIERWRGRHERAEDLSLRVLAGYERYYGPDHPKTIDARLDLADFLRQRARFDDADLLYRQALAQAEEVLGEKSPRTLDARRAHGVLLMERGDAAGAQPLFEQLVATYVRSLGERHHKTLDAMNLLAVVHYEQAHYAEAEAAWREQLAALVEERGEGHRDTIIPLVNLAMVASDLGALDEAEAYYGEGLRLCAAAYGPENDWTLDIQNNLALLLYRQGRYERSAELSRAVIDARTRLLGPTHPDTLGTKLNLAGCLIDAGRLAEADELLDATYRESLAVSGPRHPQVLNVLQSCAVVAWRRGALDLAWERIMQCAETRASVLGPRHDKTLESRATQGAIARDRGELERARDVLVETTAAMEDVLGPLHADTLWALGALAGVRRSLGDRPGHDALAERLRSAHLARAGRAEADEGALRKAAACLLDLEGPDDAASALGFAERLSQRTGGSLAGDQELLARCLAATGAREDARAVLRATLATLDELDPRREALEAELAAWASE